MKYILRKSADNSLVVALNKAVSDDGTHRISMHKGWLGYWRTGS